MIQTKRDNPTKFDLGTSNPTGMIGFRVGCSAAQLSDQTHTKVAELDGINMTYSL